MPLTRSNWTKITEFAELLWNLNFVPGIALNLLFIHAYDLTGRSNWKDEI